MRPRSGVVRRPRPLSRPIAHRHFGQPRPQQRLCASPSSRGCVSPKRIDLHNRGSYIDSMFPVVFHRRPNGTIPYEEHVRSVHHAGRKSEAARIRAFVERLRQDGSRRLVARRWAEKMNDVWQLRAGQHRVFYFWHSEAGRYVMLNGFRKGSRRTPRSELERAEGLRAEHLGS